MLTQCDTMTVPADDRREFWGQTVSDLIVPHEAYAPRNASVSARLSMADVGSLTLVKLEANQHAQALRRTSRLVRSTPADYYSFGLLLRGSMLVAQDGRQSIVARGDFMIMDCSRPYTLVSNEDVRVLSASMPRALLRVAPARIAQITATRISGQRGIGWMLVPFFDRLVQLALHDDESGSDSHRITQCTVDLIASLCEHQLGDEPPHQARSELLFRIRAYIDANLGDYGLSPERIARAHFISKSSLQRVFTSEGTSVARFIRERRLEQCRRQLGEPAHAHESVTSIGARCGLPDSSHLSRLFRDAYGFTPSEYRRDHLPDATSTVGSSEPGAPVRHKRA